MAVRSQGMVKFFNLEKGYGFIRRQKGEPDVFVHLTALKRSGINELKKGDCIEFDVCPHHAGPRADNITLQS